MIAAVITDEISQDFEHALDVMLEYDVRHAELRGLWGTNILQLSEEQRQRARQTLRKRGMSVCCIASPMYKGDLPAKIGHEALEEPLRLLERAIHAAEYFNTSLIRVFSFLKQGELTAEVFEIIVGALRAASARAEAAGVLLGLENEHACFVGTGAEAARVLTAVGSPALRAVWDPGNAFSRGEAPPEGYAAVRPWVAHVHVKDGVRDSDGVARWCLVGEGEIDYPGQVAALATDGYEGVLSLETHFKPGGDAEAGSRPSLAALRCLLAEAPPTTKLTANAF